MRAKRGGCLCRTPTGQKDGMYRDDQNGWVLAAVANSTFMKKSGLATTLITSGVIATTLAQRLNFEWRFAGAGQVPIGHQLILVQFNPGLNQFHLPPGQIALQQLTIGNLVSFIFSFLA